MPTTFTRSEVAQHNTDKDCWVIISDKVYNVTTFLDDHPGGKRAIMMYAGKDATVSVCIAYHTTSSGILFACVVVVVVVVVWHGPLVVVAVGCGVLLFSCVFF
jgi:hypothetical protein